MTEQSKLTEALNHVESIANLMEDNEWEQFMVSHLMPIKVELQRQLLILKNRL